jgi:hypothetical protein
MSTECAREYTEDVADLNDYSEESWEEATPLPKRGQHQSESKVRRLSRILDREEPPKKYRLVYNRQAGSVRLEPKQIQTANIGVALDESIEKAIETSKNILSLEDNWDEDGSPGYVKTTWARATEFIKQTAISYWKANGTWVVAPRILPGPEGSIDIHWKTSSKELLINIPSNNEVPAGYFGSGGSTDTVKGKLDTSSQNLWVLMWLLQ